MAKLFGFVQFELAGTLPLADGRYLAGSGAGDGEEEWVLVVTSLGVPAAPERRRRRRGRNLEPGSEPAPLPLTRVTAIRASAPLASPAEAARWMDEACEVEDAAEVLAAEAVAPLNRALHTHAVAAADPYGRELSPAHAERVLVGYGSGEETADGRFSDARLVDLAPRSSSRRRQREEELRPQERVAGVLRGRERLDACETLLLRARGDLDAGRDREAALQLRAGLEALLVELDGAVDDAGHAQDMETLQGRREEVDAAAEAALGGEIDDGRRAQVRELLAICERILRRRRVLRG
ncbi:MAG TPA: hypothetical protein VFK14_12135 [Solirubrobacterales bacterium]|nr:hypothetical protein [Solirubrobacterales bacterium]